LAPSAHSEDTHDVQLLDVATREYTAELHDAVGALRESAVGLAADRDAVVAGKQQLIAEFEGSVDALRASVASFVSKVHAAEACWIAEGRGVLASRVAALDDQALVMSGALNDMSAGLAASESLMCDAVECLNPLSIDGTLCAVKHAMGSAVTRGAPCVSTTLMLAHDMSVLEAGLARACVLRGGCIDGARCEVEGIGLAGFVPGVCVCVCVCV
jgi:hypothetical protein